ncbi:MAG: hypothetical protein EXX96DRAFT_611031 [Benjaminiella poitrasii]|nr:MAG: hypothetical protein EXX96DRAFT_611031 [Benjaminiella poitrasii]
MWLVSFVLYRLVVFMIEATDVNSNTLSTWASMKVSISIALHPYFQLTIILALDSQVNYAHKNLARSKISSLLFRMFATKLFKFGQGGIIKHDEELKIVYQIDDNPVAINVQKYVWIAWKA